MLGAQICSNCVHTKLVNICDRQLCIPLTRQKISICDRQNICGICDRDNINICDRVKINICDRDTINICDRQGRLLSNPLGLLGHASCSAAGEGENLAQVSFVVVIVVLVITTVVDVLVIVLVIVAVA